MFTLFILITQDGWVVIFEQLEVCITVALIDVA